MNSHGTLPSDHSSGSRAVRRARHAAAGSAYAEERGLDIAVLRPCTGGACTARRQDERVRMWPHLRHRRVVPREAAVILYCFARRSPAPIRADSVCGRRFFGEGGTAHPSSFVMLWSAPPTSSRTADLVQPFSAA